MKRKTFFKALVGLIAAPTLLANVKEEDLRGKAIVMLQESEWKQKKQYYTKGIVDYIEKNKDTFHTIDFDSFYADPESPMMKLMKKNKHRPTKIKPEWMQKDLISMPTFVTEATFNKIKSKTVNKYGINIKHLNGRSFAAHPLFKEYL